MINYYAGKLSQIHDTIDGMRTHSLTWGSHMQALISDLHMSNAGSIQCMPITSLSPLHGSMRVNSR